MLPAILYLVHRVPYPPDKGDRIRAFHLLKFLAARARVYLGCLADEPVDVDARKCLGQYCEQLEIVPLKASRWLRAAFSLARGKTATEGAFQSAGLREIVGRWSREVRFHALLASSSGMAGYLEHEGFQGISRVIDLVDVDSQKWLDYGADSSWPRGGLYRMEGKRLRRLESALACQPGGVTLVSQVELDLFRGFCPTGTARVVTNGVDADYFAPATAAIEPACVFVGALDYRPNVEGACWFAREVWPALRRLSPDVRWYIVGRSPVARIQALDGQDGIEVVGPVADVRPWLARSAVSIIPLQYARGVQNKVLEALAMARAVVASPASIAGLQVQAGTHLLPAASPAEWFEAISSLLANPSRREELGAAGRQYVLDHHCWDQCLEPLASILGLPSQLGKIARASCH